MKKYLIAFCLVLFCFSANSFALMLVDVNDGPHELTFSVFPIFGARVCNYMPGDVLRNVSCSMTDDGGNLITGRYTVKLLGSQERATIYTGKVFDSSKVIPIKKGDNSIEMQIQIYQSVDHAKIECKLLPQIT